MQQSIVTADYFSHFDDARLRNMVVYPPYEKNPSDYSAYVRGNIKIYMPNDGPPSGVPKPFIFTGPRLKIAYGGCRWNRMTFSVNQSPECEEFLDWMRSVNRAVRTIIYDNPEKYKNGCKTNMTFSYDEDVAKASSDPNLYPAEIRTRLSTIRLSQDDEVVNAHLFRIEDGQEIAVDSKDITAGSYCIPIIKVNYFRNGTRFGLNMTVIKARIWLNDLAANKIENKDWVMDYPAEAMDEDSS